MLSKQEIKNRLAVKPVEVEVESLGGAVYARQITLSQRRELDALEKAADKKEAEPFDSEVWLIMNGVCDADGKLLFNNGDREWLTDEAPARLVTDMAKAVLEANGWQPDAVEEEAGN